jgi:hypothetical protein
MAALPPTTRLVAAKTFTLVAAIALCVTVAGCSAPEVGGRADEAAGPEAPGEAATLPPPAGRRFPPNSVEAMRALYDPVLAPLGVRLTRAALIDTSDGRYTKSDDGTHLALYVAPLEPDPERYPTARYVEGIWTITALLTPDVFTRWPGVQSYDVCQEGLTPPPPGGEPPTETQVNIERPAADKIDWTSGSLVDLLAVSIDDTAIRVVVSKHLRESTEYQSAWRAAFDRARPPQTGPSAE